MNSFGHGVRPPSESNKRGAVGPKAVDRALADRSTGQPLGPALQLALEHSFGRPLDDVRVHSDRGADELARGLGSEAFTRGREIYFRGGRYDSSSPQPDGLLAHEVAHTVQQQGGATAATLSHRGDASEVQAERAARSVGRGAAMDLAAPARPPQLQRFESKEHERLGDVTGVADIDLGGGVHLSWGQVIALAGDYYATVEDLLADTRTPDGHVRIRAALDHYGSPAAAATHLPPSAKSDQDEAGKRLVLLALRNVAHFVEGGDAHATWLDYHSRAITSAVSAGLARDRTKLAEAYLLEAFGQHFLTDSFAAGHIRTPRRDIIDWYVGTFAPRVFDHLVDTLRGRIVDGVYDQIPGSYKAVAIVVLGPFAGPAAIRYAIRSRVQDEIDAGVTKLGGRASAIEWLGLGVAGAVSGAIHDTENVRGLLVSSVERPQGWTSYGDANLDKIAPGETVAENRIQAENAVKAAKKDIDDAFDLAEAESTLKSTATPPAALPSAVYFGFDHADLSPALQTEVRAAALYLVYNPDAEVDLVGHTDPVGTDKYNDDLSLQRAQSVAAAIAREGVAPARIPVSSKGEHEPVTSDPRQYWRNRRVVFTWRTSAGATATHDVALEHVQKAIRLQVGPPYRAEGFLPTPIAGANRPLPDWHWGSMPKDLRDDVATWVGSHLTGPLTAALALPALDPKTITVAGQTITIEPRPIATVAATDFLADPITFLNDAFGEKAGP